ncbi:glycosyltransferase involved in cell wall biosynthesis [Rhodoblastus acidophilus]|uniref:glycosyltransferase n=1 Tax=Rhodoblastus acidophilus TaxID=1074 RepID=UPI0022254E7A|nr:glycosyltransferase [Rhodoblastus acidophilus]MCW2318943.1 glycosyltransferase involved in cell wall biosynthesis [Rhodoblastus acidophilus]
MRSNEKSLRILHVFRAPVGGLFRHVMDLAGEQASRGHEVGLIVDSLAGGERAEQQLAAIAPRMKLGVVRFPMHREPHLGDLSVLARTYARIWRLRPDIVHAHGAKGGLYARLTGFLPLPKRPARVYTPHGGSFHQVAGHRAYMLAERLLGRQTDLLQFESDYMARKYASEIGPGAALVNVARNGVCAGDFVKVTPAPDAAEFVYVGELAARKGVDILIEAFAKIHAGGQFAPRLVIIGSGPDREALAALVEKSGLSRHIAMRDPQPAQKALAAGRIVVAPSRVESLPYMFLEAIACGRPLIAAAVGGVEEIFGPYRDKLIPPGDPAALAAAMIAALQENETAQQDACAALTQYVKDNFQIASMVDSIMDGYARALARREPQAIQNSLRAQ